MLSATESDGSRIFCTATELSSCGREVSVSTVCRVTDWRGWHDDYEDPASELSHRLRSVQRLIRDCADEHPPGDLRILSMCAGQAHDVVGALRDHDRGDDVVGLLVELDAANVAATRAGLQHAGLVGLHVVAADGGVTTPYRSATPADLILACGVFGNIPDSDVRRTVAALPMLSAPGATVIWTRHRREPDLTGDIQDWFSAAGFEEVAFVSSGPGRFCVGAHRLLGAPQPYQPNLPLFTFVA